LLAAQTPSAVSLFSSLNPATYGAPVTIAATVTPSAATGRVTFYDGVTPLGDSAVSGGQAVLTTQSLTTGLRSLRAHYSGDSTYAPADAPALAQTVNSLPAAGFSPVLTYFANTGEGPVATGDFNHDGRIDLVVAGSSNYVTIFLGSGDGTFQQLFPYQIWYSPTGGVAVGDLYNDGIPNLVTSGYGVTVWNRSGEEFWYGPTYGSGGQSGVQLADFNGDGNLDVLAANGNLDLQIWWGNGDGTLAAGPVLTLAENGLPGFVVGDFNGDGIADIASIGVTPASNSFVVFLGNGDGTFTRVDESTNASLIASQAGVGSQLLAADVNNDGKVDLVVATGGTISVLLGNGDGTFQPPIEDDLNADIFLGAIADFNGDGKPDLAILDWTKEDIAVLPGNGDGTFQAATVQAAAGGFPYAVAVGDFNGDGRVDIAVSVNSEAGSGLSILLGQAAAPPTVQAVSVTPSSGSGSSQSFTFQFSDSAGGADIATMSVEFFGPSSQSPCVVTYTRSTGSLALVPSLLTSPTAIQNGSCTVQLAQSGPTAPAGTMQAFNLAVTFDGMIQGTQTVYGLVTSAGGSTSGWQALGTWNVPLVTVGPAKAVSVAPASGTGMTQTFVFTYVDPYGLGDLASVMAAVGPSTASRSCIVQVTPYANWASFASSAGSSEYSTGGSIGALGSQGVVQIGLCSLNLAASSGSWSGNTYAVALSLAFAPSFSGPQSIYGKASSYAVPGLGWQTLGTWTVASPCAVFTDSTTPTVADVQQTINEALGIAASNNDLNGDGVVNVADVQKVIEAAMGVGCLY
jgi:hypothetical protein